MRYICVFRDSIVHILAMSRMQGSQMRQTPVQYSAQRMLDGYQWRLGIDVASDAIAVCETIKESVPTLQVSMPFKSSPVDGLDGTVSNSPKAIESQANQRHQLQHSRHERAGPFALVMPGKHLTKKRCVPDWAESRFQAAPARSARARPFVLVLLDREQISSKPTANCCFMLSASMRTHRRGLTAGREASAHWRN